MTSVDLSVRFFLQLAFILGVCRLVGMLARRIGQSQVVSEMIAGVLMGPSLLGLLTRGQAPAPAANGPAGQTGTLNINGVDVRAGPETLDGFRTHRLLYR